MKRFLVRVWGDVRPGVMANVRPDGRQWRPCRQRRRKKNIWSRRPRLAASIKCCGRPFRGRGGGLGGLCQRGIPPPSPSKVKWYLRQHEPFSKQRMRKCRNDSYHIFVLPHARREHGTNHCEVFSQQREVVQIVANFSVAKSKEKSKRNRSKT